MDLFTYALAKGGQGSGGTGITVDSVLSDASENPVQNKVLKAALDSKANAADVPTDTAQLTNGAGFVTPGALLNYPTKTELDNNFPTKNDMAAALSAKADTATVNAALALKANSSDVTAQIAAAIGSVSSFEYYLCGNGEYDPQTGVPTVQNPDAEHVYLVPTGGTNLNMYAYINSGFTFLGTTEVDLSGYVQESDLADVATSGSYEDLDDTPDIPTDTADLTNGAGFITKPQTTYFSVTPDWSEALPNGYIGGVQTAYMYYKEITREEALSLQALNNVTSAIYLNNTDTVLTEPDGETPAGDVCLAFNIKPTETGAESGYDAEDTSKPIYVVNMAQTEDSSTGYLFIIIASERLDNGEWRVFSQQDYLTEHQSLAGYATTAAVNAALADYASKTYVDSAVTGKQDTLTFDNSPTANSNNPVKSGGVYTALAGKQATLTFDSTPQSGSSNPVKSKGIYNALAAKANAADLAAVATSGSYNDLSNKPTIPSIPEKLVTGSAKAYTVVVANSAPAAGTADSVITIVV